MKILFSLLTILMLNKECDKKDTNLSQTVTPTETTSNMNQEEQVTITYEAMSRGLFEKVWITKDAVIVSNDRNLVEKSTYLCVEKDWNDIMTLLDKVDLKSLPNLEAPTAKRLYDGAAHASLSITKSNETIQSNSFDHGYPPAAIEKLVNKVLSIMENAKKQ